MKSEKISFHVLRILASAVDVAFRTAITISYVLGTFEIVISSLSFSSLLVLSHCRSWPLEGSAGDVVSAKGVGAEGC